MVSLPLGRGGKGTVNDTQLCQNHQPWVISIPREEGKQEIVPKTGEMSCGLSAMADRLQTAGNSLVFQMEGLFCLLPFVIDVRVPEQICQGLNMRVLIN